MAKEKAVWEKVDEAEKLIAKLCEMYPEKIGHVEPEAIGVAAITNKDRPESAEWDSKIKGVKEPEALYCTKQYVILFYKSTWDGYNAAQRSAMLMRQLLRIPEDKDGGVLVEDLKDVKCMVKAFGVDYIENPKLPDLAKEKVDF